MVQFAIGAIIDPKSGGIEIVRLPESDKKNGRIVGPGVFFPGSNAPAQTFSSLDEETYADRTMYST